jgi:hypothetical protein
LPPSSKDRINNPPTSVVDYTLKMPFCQGSNNHCPNQ